MTDHDVTVTLKLSSWANLLRCIKHEDSWLRMEGNFVTALEFLEQQIASYRPECPWDTPIESICPKHTQSLYECTIRREPVPSTLYEKLFLARRRKRAL